VSGPIDSGTEHELRDQAGQERGDQCNGEERSGRLVLASNSFSEGVESVSDEGDHGERGGQEKCGLKDLEEQF
jgi:hypothetical protein